MDGMEFMRHLGESGMPVAVILTSAHEHSLLASVATMGEAYGIRLLGTVQKPATVQKLQTLIGHYQFRTASQPKPAKVLFSEQEIFAALDARLFEPLFQPKVAEDGVGQAHR
jgi:hypothetical protein